MNMNKYFETSDLALATFLSLSYSIEYIDRNNPQKVVFSFRDDGQIQAIVERFWKREFSIEPIAYFDQLRLLKSRIYKS